ncbi:MAG: hypothetical protein QM790_03695 [Nibricoccus sp.]
MRAEEQLSGQPQLGSWFECMMRGDFASAWEIADADLLARRDVPCWHWPRHEQYVWNGSSLQGKRVLVRCYHGLGDTLQFVRYLPLLSGSAVEVTVWAQPVLLPLLRTMKVPVNWIPLHDGVPEVEYDVDIELMELPHFFRSTLETLPRMVPYFHVEPCRSAQLGPGLNVGVAWASGAWDPNRDVPIKALAPLAELDGVTLHALQAGPALTAWPRAWGPVSTREKPEQLASFMRSLDLVISVDSMPAHLAGSLGVPVWTLLCRQADWRWMKDRPDSPWYPTMTLFRQEKPGEWASVVAKVTSDLRTRSASNVSRRS